MQSVAAHQIVENFSAMAHTYDSYAHVQEMASRLLINLIQEKKNSLPVGTAVEIGAGTGLLSVQLPAILTERPLMLVEPSANMVQICQQRMEACAHDNVRYCNLYSEQWYAQEPVALITSSFSLQWCENFCLELSRLAGQLAAGGALAVAVPVSGSFDLWQKICQQEGVPSTLNNLPAIEDIKTVADQLNARLDLQEHFIKDPSVQALQFLRSLRGLGAHTRLSGKPLTAGMLRRLVRRADSLMQKGEGFSFRVAVVWMQK